jgi:hypothetical protein
MRQFRGNKLLLIRYSYLSVLGTTLRYTCVVNSKFYVKVKFCISCYSSWNSVNVKYGSKLQSARYESTKFLLRAAHRNLLQFPMPAARVRHVQKRGMNGRHLKLMSLCHSVVKYVLFSLYLNLTPWSWALLEKQPIVQLLKELPNILWNPKFHSLVHKSPPLAPILSQINQIHTIPSYLSKVNLLLSTLRLGLPSGLFPSGIPTSILY